MLVSKRERGDLSAKEKADMSERWDGRLGSKKERAGFVSKGEGQACQQESIAELVSERKRVDLFAVGRTDLSARERADFSAREKSRLVCSVRGQTCQQEKIAGLVSKGDNRFVSKEIAGPFARGTVSRKGRGKGSIVRDEKRGISAREKGRH